MATQRFSSHGFEFEFEDNTGEILAAFENAVARGLDVIGGVAVGHAQDEIRTPKQVYPGVVQDAVDTSRLLQSVAHSVQGDEVYIGSNVSYAAVIEYGSGPYSTTGGGTQKEHWVYKGEDGKFHMAFPQMARPFLKPAASEHTEEYRKILLDSLENA